MVWTDLKFHGGRFLLSALCLASVLGPAHLGATLPPTNDLCTGAVVIPGGGPFPYWSPVIPDVNGATTNADPVPACVLNAVSNGVWYTFTPSASGLYAFSTADDTATTVRDTAMAIYTSAGGCSGPFTSLDCNDDGAGREALRAALSLSLNAGTTYYIVVWKTLGLDFPWGTALQLRVTKPVPPANDTCAGAEVIPSGPSFPQLSTTNDLTKAATAGDPPAPSCQSDVTNSVWFRFTPTNSGTYVFSTDESTATTVYNPVMALYTASGSCSGFSQVACDYQLDAHATIIASNLTLGTTYYIVVWDLWDGDLPTPGETSVQLRVARQRRPIVTTLAASSVASTSAVLNASINANYVTTRAWFEWGTTTNYGASTPPRLIGKGGGDVTTNALITGLTAGTLYHFRAVATNSLGTNYGDDRVFMWLNTRPQITAWERQADGSYRLRFTATSGQAYRIDASTDLPSWGELGVAQDLGNGLFEFVDANAGRIPRRFYRVKAP